MIPIKENWTLWFKDRYDLAYGPKSFTSVIEFDCATDMFGSASSTIICDVIPSNVNVGDFCILLDYRFVQYHVGIIDSIDGNKLVVLDILTALDYEVAFPKGWHWRGRMSEVHQKYFDLAISQLKYYQRVDQTYRYDTKQQEFFDQFRCTSADTDIIYEYVSESNEVKNVYDEMIEVQRAGYIYRHNFAIDKPFFGTDIDEKVTIACFDHNPYAITTIIENDETQINIVQEDSQYNKISIFYETPRKGEDPDIMWDRGCYYITKSGRTSNPDASRNNVCKNKVVFTDDPSLTAVLNKEVNRQLYNHRIEIDFLSDNGVYDFLSYPNGQRLNVMAQNKLWETIKTGHRISWKRGQDNVNCQLICGYVRNRATEFWFQTK